MLCFETIVLISHSRVSIKKLNDIMNTEPWERKIKINYQIKICSIKLAFQVSK